VAAGVDTADAVGAGADAVVVQLSEQRQTPSTSDSRQQMTRIHSESSEERTPYEWGTRNEG
jgi:hypothetical protein